MVNGAEIYSKIKHAFQGEDQEKLQKQKDLKKKAKKLDKLYLKSDEVSEKVVQQEALNFMRNKMNEEKMAIDITYPINPPFAFVNIIFNDDDGEFHYILQEPKLTDHDEEKLEVIIDKIEDTMDKEEIPEPENPGFGRSHQLNEYLDNVYNKVIYLYDIDVEKKKKRVLHYYLKRNLLGLGRADPLVRDPFIEDISCNGPDIPLYIYHRIFGSMRTNIEYPREMELNKHIVRLAQIAGKHISVNQPILDAMLSDGSRINLTLGSEVTKKGSTFTIRKFSIDPISPIDLIRFGSVSPLMLAYFWILIENKRSMLISGGTASGKTTLLNALCMFMRPEDKIVSIEDTPEIHIDHENWIQSVARTGFGAVSGMSGASGVSGISNRGSGLRPGDISLYDLLVAALRQRPEYVIVGEVRGSEAFTLFQAISVGHSSMSTIHAGSVSELLHRVENEPMNIPRVLVQSLDAVAFQAQVLTGGNRVRRLRGITEILELEKKTNNLLTNDVFDWDPEDDSFEFHGQSYVFEEIAKETGKKVHELMEELKRRERYIELMDLNNMTHYEDVSKAINEYYVDPENAYTDLDITTI